VEAKVVGSAAGGKCLQRDCAVCNEWLQNNRLTWSTRRTPTPSITYREAHHSNLPYSQSSRLSTAETRADEWETTRTGVYLAGSLKFSIKTRDAGGALIDKFQLDNKAERLAEIFVNRSNHPRYVSVLRDNFPPDSKKISATQFE